MKNNLSNLTKLNNVSSLVDIKYRIGMRVVKTAASVMVCLLISHLMDSHTSIPIIAVSALVTLCATPGESVHIAFARVLGTGIGGIFGALTVVIGLFLPYYNDGLYIVIIPLVLVLNLYVCNVLKIQDSCTISCVVTIIVASQMEAGATINVAIVYTLLRLRDTFIGVAVATIINTMPNQIAWLRKRIGRSM